MCRFVAYLGESPVILSDVVAHPENSLVSQSQRSSEQSFGLNGDGFGLGWYDHAIDDTPGRFKSTRPAWNDKNLGHISSKIRSKCFIGHVRASSIGDVTLANCHPFGYRQFLFAHNGKIDCFNKIKRPLIEQLQDDFYHEINGQTDSEHFFILVMDILSHESSEPTLDQMAEAVLEAIRRVRALQSQLENQPFFKLNAVLTDGRQMLAVRYTAGKTQAPLSLHYAVGNHIKQDGQGVAMLDQPGRESALLVASEVLTDYAQRWQEVPANHMLLAGRDYEITLRSIDELL